jgi:hypothetical protein
VYAGSSSDTMLEKKELIIEDKLYRENQCCKHHVGEYIAEGPENNLSATSGKILEIIRKYRQT